MHRTEQIIVLATAAGTVTAAWTQRGGPVEELFVAFSLATFAGLARSTTARFDGYRVTRIVADLLSRLVASWFIGICFWFLLLDRLDFGFRVAVCGLASLFAAELIDALGGRVDWFLNWALSPGKKR